MARIGTLSEIVFLCLCPCFFFLSLLVSGINGQSGRESKRRLHEIWRFGLGLVILSLSHDDGGIIGTSTTRACRRQQLSINMLPCLYMGRQGFVNIARDM